MRVSSCPKCGAKVAQSDNVCMDCGEDLIAASQDIVQQAMKEAKVPAGPASPAAAVASAAAAGLVLPGENADEKRLRVFDQQEADLLRKQRPAMVVILLLALAGAVVMFAVAANTLKQAEGWAGVKSLSVAEFKKLGIDVFSDPRVMFVLAAGVALACTLCVIGEARRLWGTCTAIAAVSRSETPNVVHISVFTQIGLIVGAFCAPPVGLILGIIFKFSKDEDTRSIGSLMIYASLLAAAILVVNWIWSLASASLPAKSAPAIKGGGDEGVALWRLIA
ncbi:MAG: zinc ribbon domain-containing protein [Armatimonadetes bacterium]|nr:zinc ribbon domain-containing protein [Armatimonadota bacterium]